MQEPKTIKKAYKYRINPTKEQEIFFAKTLFLTYLRYKAEWYGITFIQVTKFFPSSKLCHCCGYKKEDLALYERTWTCHVCEKAHDRDVNASINLYFGGLERPEVKPLKHALIDDLSGYLKSHHTLKKEASPSIRWSSSRDYA
jgi:putative transposase